MGRSRLLLPLVSVYLLCTVRWRQMSHHPLPHPFVCTAPPIHSPGFRKNTSGQWRMSAYSPYVLVQEHSMVHNLAWVWNVGQLVHGYVNQFCLITGDRKCIGDVIFILLNLCCICCRYERFIYLTAEIPYLRLVNICLCIGGKCVVNVSPLL